MGNKISYWKLTYQGLAVYDLTTVFTRSRPGQAILHHLMTQEKKSFHIYSFISKTHSLYIRKHGKALCFTGKFRKPMLIQAVSEFYFDWAWSRWFSGRATILLISSPRFARSTLRRDAIVLEESAKPARLPEVPALIKSRHCSTRATRPGVYRRCNWYNQTFGNDFANFRASQFDGTPRLSRRWTLFYSEQDYLWPLQGRAVSIHNVSRPSQAMSMTSRFFRFGSYVLLDSKQPNIYYKAILYFEAIQQGRCLRLWSLVWRWDRGRRFLS